jgi:hypothetical protein
MIMRHLKIYEDFNLDDFLENPDKYVHDEENPNIEIGSYVETYRGPGQIIDTDRNFWVVRLIDKSQSVIKVPKETVTKKMKLEDVNRLKKYSSGVKTDEELKSICDDLEAYIEANIEDDPEEGVKLNFKIARSFEIIEEILVDLIAINKSDSSMTSKENYGRLLSYLAFLFDCMMEVSNESSEVRKKLGIIFNEIKKL